MKFVFVAIEQMGNSSLMLIGRSLKNGKKYIFYVNGFTPYYFIPSYSKTGYKSIFGENVKKRLLQVPRQMFNDRKRYETTYESDVPHEQRFLYDKGITSGFKVQIRYAENISGKSFNVNEEYVSKCTALKDSLVRLYFDVETESLAYDDPDRVYAVGFWDNKTKKYRAYTWGDNLTEERKALWFDSLWFKERYKATVIICTGETNMFLRVIEDLVQLDPDVISGYNIYGFDMPYLINRAEKLGISFNAVSPKGRVEDRKIAGRMLSDLYVLYKDIIEGQPRRKRLLDVAEIELGIEMEKQPHKMTEWFENDKMQLGRYVLTDVDVTVGIDQKMGLFDFYRDIVEITACRFENAITNSRVIDSLMLLVRDDNTILPRYPRFDEPPPDHIEGGYVIEPKYLGNIPIIFVVDLKRMYPSIMDSMNMSVETVYTLKGETRFRSAPPGFTPKVIQFLFKKRDVIQAQKKQHEAGSPDYNAWNVKDQAVKRVLNSIFGLFKYAKFRCHDWRISEKILRDAREMTKALAVIAESFGYEVIYGDTDSLHILGNELSVEEGQRMQNVLNTGLDIIAKDMGLDEHTFFLEFEKIFSPIFYSTKKRYAGMVVWADDWLSVPSLEVRGFEYRRSDSSDETLELQKVLFKMALGGCSEEVCYNYVLDRFERAINGFTSVLELARPIGLGKNPMDFENDCIQKKAALYNNMHLGGSYEKDDKLLYAYVKSTGGLPPTTVCCVEDKMQFPVDIKFDWVKMAQKNILDKAEPVFEAQGWGDLKNKFRMDDIKCDARIDLKGRYKYLMIQGN